MAASTSKKHERRTNHDYDDYNFSLIESRETTGKIANIFTFRQQFSNGFISKLLLL